MFGGNFAPAGWAFCAGQLMAISENDTLFNLIGTTYGGDGQSTFGLPDLRGRVPIHMGTGGGGSYSISQTGGAETVQLNTTQIPIHSHLVLASANAGTDAKPTASTYLSTEGPSGVQVGTYQPFTGASQVQLANNTIQNTGSSLAHDNMQPYLCVSFIISLFGVYPSPN